jgi:hypothetical protein
MKHFSKSLAVFSAFIFMSTFAWNVSAAQPRQPDRDRESRKPAPHERVTRDRESRKPAPHQRVTRDRESRNSTPIRRVLNERVRRIPVPRPGHVRSRLPKGYWAVRHGRSQHYYHHGTFYRRGPSGYIVVKAPIGAIVFGIPLGYHRVFIGGSLYFTYGGVYYRRVPSGYVVVEPPREVVVAEPAPDFEAVVGDQVTVTAERLNVRSGSALDRAIVAKVSRGTVLDVHASTEDWLYVELPDGEFGWVLARYTMPLQEPASG